MDAVDAAVNAGASGGFLRIYNGTRPATGGTATTLLAELRFSSTAFGAAAGGVITAAAITSDASANATGTATWFRVTDSDGDVVMDGSAGLTGSGADLELAAVAVSAGQEVRVTSFVDTEGNP
jgi:hypothetical protein